MAQPATKPDATAALIARHPSPASASKWANAARHGALQRLTEMGAPGRRDEYWRYTDPTSLAAQPVVPLVAQVQDNALFSGVDALKLVFVDGIFSADLSDEPAGSGYEIDLLSDAMAKDIHWARDVFGMLEARGQDPVARPLAALNSAVASEGLAIRVTGAASRAISVEYLHQSETSDAVVHHVILLEEGASLTMLETGPGAARLNTCLEVDLAKGSAFNHVRAQGRDQGRRAATHMFARLAAEAQFKSFTLSVNGAMTRNEMVVEMNGDNAAAHVAGACAGDGAFHHDDTVFVTHDAANCESRQVFKKVLRNGATGVFQGKILVRAGAQKTDGYQISQGLLLDDDSQFLAKPELEIYADDVVCSHGSTCGAVDETALFYLTSRGVSKAEAQDMLVLAFLDEAIQEVENDQLADAIRARLGDWLSRRHS